MVFRTLRSITTRNGNAKAPLTFEDACFSAFTLKITPVPEWGCEASVTDLELSTSRSSSSDKSGSEEVPSDTSSTTGLSGGFTLPRPEIWRWSENGLSKVFRNEGDA